MKSNKTKLLIVYRGLEQAGSQRWIYEICSHLDKESFEVGVLCDRKYVNCSHESNYENYYYLKLKELKICLYEYIGDEKQGIWNRGIRKIRRAVNKFLPNIIVADAVAINHKIVKLFELYDVICVVDFLGYKAVKKELYKSKNIKFFVVLHSHKFQFKTDHYNHFDKTKSYNFTYFCPKQITEISESGIDIGKSNFFYNPLILNLTNYPYLFNPLNNNRIIIAIFTRISRMKPIDVFIKAFAKLRQQSLDKCILKIYGEVQDQNYYQQLQDLIKTLQMNNQDIIFAGHVEDIAQTIKQDKINIYWGMSINSSIGYASIEVGAMGIPSVFWNYDDQTSSIYVQEQTSGVMLSYNHISDFIDSNLIYLSSNSSLADLSIKQREYFTNNHNIVSRIERFQDYVKSI